MMRFLLVPVVVTLAVSTAASQEPLPTNEALIARAKSLELDTPYVPPPGDALEHHTSGFAKIMCSAVFITGLDPEFAAENIGYFTSPYAERAKVGKPVIDRANQTVHITLPSEITRTAKYLGSQGCVTLPIGQSSVNFTPVSVKSGLPDPSTQRWPMGDVLAEGPLPAEIDAAKLKQAVNAAFEPAEAMTAAFVVTWRGRLAAERYGEGLTARTPLEGWSMGKSLTATLLGILIKQGVYELAQPAPIPEWQTPGDPACQDPDFGHPSHVEWAANQGTSRPRLRPHGTYPDHLYYYTGRIDAFNYAATRPQQWPPNTVGRYRNTDPVLANYLVRLAVKSVAKSTCRSRSAVCSTRSASARWSSRPTRTAIFSRRDTTSCRLTRLGAPGQSLPPGRRLEW